MILKNVMGCGLFQKNPRGERVRGLTVEDIDFPGNIKERTYGNSRGSVKQGALIIRFVHGRTSHNVGRGGLGAK